MGIKRKKQSPIPNKSCLPISKNEAAALDDKLIAAWTGHPHLQIIDNASDFEDKMKHLISEIASFLGEPEPYEIKRKYLIEYPNIKALEMLSNCEKVEIIQTYLKSDDGEEVRIRQRGSKGHYIYFETHKKSISGLKRVEIERKLSKDEYLERLMDADTTKRSIRCYRVLISFSSSRTASMTAPNAGTSP